MSAQSLLPSPPHICVVGLRSHECFDALETRTASSSSIICCSMGRERRQCSEVNVDVPSVLVMFLRLVLALAAVVCSSHLPYLVLHSPVSTGCGISTPDHSLCSKRLFLTNIEMCGDNYMHHENAGLLRPKSVTMRQSKGVLRQAAC